MGGVTLMPRQAGVIGKTGTDFGENRNGFFFPDRAGVNKFMDETGTIDLSRFC